MFPTSVPGGFGYFDSSFAAPSFVFHTEEGDSSKTAMTRTLNQINTLNLSSMAWNDQFPNGSESSTKAHAKGVIGYDEGNSAGFLIVHSIPKFPAFNNGVVNSTIDDKQTIYGQHVFCLSIDNLVFYDLISKILPIKPYLYIQNFNDKNYLNNLMAAGLIQQPDYKSTFSYKSYTLNGTNMQFIFKNGAVNASIFEDGLNNMLKSPIVAETWGRPLQDKWCGSPYGVGNV